MSDDMADGVTEWRNHLARSGSALHRQLQNGDVDGDGTISADEFKAACGKGLVKNPKP